MIGACRNGWANVERLRSGRTLSVTDAGHVLLPMAREIVENSVRAAERMELMKREVHGHLIVGCNAASGKYILPILCTKFHQRYPLVRISCQVLPQDLTLGRLAEGKIHFAFTTAKELDPGSAEFRLYLQERLILAAPKDHAWLKDIEKLNVLLETGASEAIALAVQEGLGLGFISKRIVQKICRDRVGSVKVRGLDIIQNIYFGRQIVRPASGAQVAFWDFILGLDTSIFDT